MSRLSLNSCTALPTQSLLTRQARLLTTDASNRTELKIDLYIQVLSNPELRARYDQHGEDGLDVNFMDGAEFFTMLFGCDRFEHLVGELMLATLARVGDKASPAQLEKVRVSLPLSMPPISLLASPEIIDRWVTSG